MIKIFKKYSYYVEKNLFICSEANIFFKSLLKKEVKFFYKKFEIPIFEELIELIKSIRSFKPDLILAIGGGTIIDYAKISNCVEIRNDLKKLILNYSYPFKKNILNFV